jgi:hypothetical protein
MAFAAHATQTFALILRTIIFDRNEFQMYRVQEHA